MMPPAPMAPPPQVQLPGLEVPSANGPATEVLCLMNMVTPEELLDLSEYEGQWSSFTWKMIKYSQSATELAVIVIIHMFLSSIYFSSSFLCSTVGTLIIQPCVGRDLGQRYFDSGYLIMAHCMSIQMGAFNTTRDVHNMDIQQFLLDGRLKTSVVRRGLLDKPEAPMSDILLCYTIRPSVLYY